MIRRALFTLVNVGLVCALAGCAGVVDLSERDLSALSTLADVAGPTSDLDPVAVTSTQCWLPSEHMVDDPSVAGDTVWKVLCRVHYTDPNGDRYRDATCIGDFASEPMLDHCYRWTHYDFAPTFEDFPAIAAG